MKTQNGFTLFEIHAGFNTVVFLGPFTSWGRKEIKLAWVHLGSLRKERLRNSVKLQSVKPLLKGFSKVPLPLTFGLTKIML